MERVHSRLHLADEARVCLEVVEHNRVVDMRDADIVVVQLSAPHHVFVAVAAETLVEGDTEDDVAAHHEVRRVEVLVFPRLSAFGGVVRFVFLLHTVAYVVTETTAVASDAKSAARHFHVFQTDVSAYEVVGAYLAVAVEEEQVFVLCLRGEEIPYCRPAHILLSHDIAAASQFVDAAVRPGE